MDCEESSWKGSSLFCSNRRRFSLSFGKHRMLLLPTSADVPAKLRELPCGSSLSFAMNRDIFVKFWLTGRSRSTAPCLAAALHDCGFRDLLSGLVINPALRHACRGIVVALRALHHRCAMRFMAIAAVCFAMMVAMRVERFVCSRPSSPRAWISRCRSHRYGSRFSGRRRPRRLRSVRNSPAKRKC